MPKLIQSSLSGGEISPAVAARVDIAKYKSSVAFAENVFCKVHGGMENRAGFRYVAQCKDSATQVRLIPFQFNTAQTYVLEFGNLYMRVVKDGGQVLSSTTATINAATKANPCVVTTAAVHGFVSADEVYISGVVGMTELNNRTFNVTVIDTTSFSLQDLQDDNIDSTGFTTYASAGTATGIFELVTPYTTAMLSELKYVQSADVMTITHPDIAPKELTRTDHNAWTIADIVFYPETVFPTNVNATVNSTGSTTVEYAVTSINVDTDEESLRGVLAYDPINAINLENPARIHMPTAHNLVRGDEIEINQIVGTIELNNRRYRVHGVPTSTSITLSDTSFNNVDATGYTAYVSGGRYAPAFKKVTNSHDTTTDNTVTWAAMDGAGSYNVYKNVNGIFGFIGVTELETFHDDNIEADTDDTPPVIRNPFIGTNNFPSTVGYYQQRRLFANTNNHPQRIFMSQTSNISNMASSIPGKDDDAIIITIAAMQVNEIRHLVPLSDMVVLTSGGEWLLGGAADAAITPATVEVTPQTYFGCTDLQPIVSGANVLFVEPGSIIRDLGYRYETDSYSGNDISILARHLFDNKTLDDWCYKQSPDSIIYTVRNDGVLLSLTYLKEQEVFGWTRNTTKGDFTSCTSIAEGNLDAVYVVVQRKVGGNSVKYIERMDDRGFEVLEDAFFVDAGLTYDVPVTITGYTNANPIVVTAAGHGFSDGDTIDISDILEVDTTTTQGKKPCTSVCGVGFTVASATTDTFALQLNGSNVDGTSFPVYFSDGKVRKQITEVSNLWHLEGESVVGSANGNAIGPLVVAQGKVTIPDGASRIHIGLSYQSQIKTLKINVPSTTGETVQAREKKLSRLTVRTEKCMGMLVGPDLDSMREVKFGLPAQFGQPRVLFEGDKNTTLKPSWSKDGQFFIRQVEPLPMTVLAVIPDALLGGN